MNALLLDEVIVRNGKETQKNEPQTPLQVLEEIQYRAPFKSFDPRQYEAFYTKHIYPIKYLDAIGIEIICDLLLNQFSPKQIAIALQISQHILMRWVDADPARADNWEWALKHEADNLMFEAKDRLVEAYAPPEKLLDKAEKIANHNRIMAKGFGSKRWGQKVDVSGMPTGATVSYTFNVGLLPEQKEKLVKDERVALENSVKENLKANETFSFSQFVGSGIDAVDISIPKDNMGYEEAKAQES